jgi:hypothetical protein
MHKVPFDAAHPDLEMVRQVVLRRLREQPGWKALEEPLGRSFGPYFDLSPPRHDDTDVLGFTILEVFWQLVVEGIIAPGVSANQGGFPHFRVTTYGRTVLQERDYSPHERGQYLKLLQERIPTPDKQWCVCV